MSFPIFRRRRKCASESRGGVTGRFTEKEESSPPLVGRIHSRSADEVRGEPFSPGRQPQFLHRKRCRRNGETRTVVRAVFPAPRRRSPRPRAFRRLKKHGEVLKFAARRSPPRRRHRKRSGEYALSEKNSWGVAGLLSPTSAMDFAFGSRFQKNGDDVSEGSALPPQASSTAEVLLIVSLAAAGKFFSSPVARFGSSCRKSP